MRRIIFVVLELLLLYKKKPVISIKRLTPISPKCRKKATINLLNPEDILVVTQLDRFATSIGDAVDIIASIRDKQASIHILNIGLVDFSILGNILFKTLCAVNNFDKALLVERIQSGKNKAKKTSGFKEGRPKKFSEEQIQEALDMLNSYSYKKVEELTGISKSTLIRAKKQAIK